MPLIENASWNQVTTTPDWLNRVLFDAGRSFCEQSRATGKTCDELELQNHRNQLNYLNGFVPRKRQDDWESDPPRQATFASRAKLVCAIGLGNVPASSL